MGGSDKDQYQLKRARKAGLLMQAPSGFAFFIPMAC